MADVIATLGLRVDGSGAIQAVERVAQALEDTAQQAESTVEELKRIATQIASVAAAAELFRRSVSAAQEFEFAIAQIGTIAGVSDEVLQALGAQMVELSTQLPVQGVRDLTSGLSEIIGAGIPAAEAMDVLTVAAKAAVGGVTSVKASVDVLTTVLNGFAKQNITASEAADVLFGVVDKGKVSFDELANSFGGLVPVAAAYGIAIEDIGASVATLTANGLGAEQAIVGVRSAIVNILNPSSEFAKTFPEIAKEFGRAKLEGVGFNQFLADFTKATNGSKDALNLLFRDIQGNVAVQSLLVDGGVKVLEIQNQLAESAGKVQGAFERVNATSRAQAQILQNQIGAAFSALGAQLLPLVNVGMAQFGTVLEATRRNLPAVIGSVTALAGTFVAYRASLVAAAAIQGVVTSAGTIKAFLDLAKSVRNLASAVALLQAAGGGLKGIVSVVAGLTGGFIAFKAASSAAEKAAADIEAGLAQQADAAALAAQNIAALNAGLVETGTGAAAKAISDTADELKKVTAAARERVKAARDALELSGLEGEQLAKRQAQIKAENDLLRARAELKGEALAVTERAIVLEQQLGEALAEQEAIRARNEARKGQKERIDELARETQILREQADALAVSQAAFNAVILKQKQEAAVRAEANRAKADGIALSEEAADRIRDEIEQQDRLSRVLAANAALREIPGGIDGVFDISIPVDEAGRFAEGIAQALSAASGLTSVFGEIGTVLASVINQSAQLATNISRAQKAGIFEKNGQKQNVGFLGALGGKAGIGGTVAAISSGLGIAGAAIQLADSLDLFGRKARERARELKRLADEFNRALFEFGQFGKTQGDFSKQLRELSLGLEELVNSALKASGLNYTGAFDIDAIRTFLETLAITPFVSGRAKEALERINQVQAQFSENLRRLQKQMEATIASLVDDLEVRRLQARGQDDAAEALRFRLQQERELQKAIEEYGDFSPEYIRLLKEVQEEERKAFEARKRTNDETARANSERALNLRQFGLDLFAREVELAGDTFAATSARLEAQRIRELEAARKLLEDGTITADLFERFAAVLDGEVRRALEELLEAETRTKENLLARGLSAAGRTREAEDVSLNASQRQELVDAIRAGMSDANLALLRFVQFAEREAIATQRAIEDGTREIEATRDAELAALDLLIDVTRSAADAQIEAIDRQIDEVRRSSAAQQKALDAQIAAVQADAKARAEEIEAQKRALNESVQTQRDQLKALEETSQAARQAAEALADFRDSLQLGQFSPLSPEDQLAEARRQFETLAARALGGDADAAGELPAAANALLKASRDFNASNTGFVEDFNRVNDIIAQAQVAFAGQADADEQTRALLEEQIRQVEEQVAKLDEQKTAIEQSAALQVAALEEQKQQARQAAEALLASLESQKEAITADAEATIAKLEEQRVTIEEAAQRQIEQLIAAEEAALQTRLRENEFYDQFQQYAATAEAFYAAERERRERGDSPSVRDQTGSPLTVGAGNEGTTQPVGVTLEQSLSELRTLNTSLVQRLDAAVERLAALTNVAVTDAEQTDLNLRAVQNATLSVVQEVRSLAQASAARNAPVGIGR